MSSYDFTKEVKLVVALDDYLRKNSCPRFNGVNYENDINKLIILTTQELTQSELEQLTTLVNNYNDPPYFLQLSHTQSLPLTSFWTSTQNERNSDGKTIMQTYIYSGNTEDDPTEVLDGIKTIFEYHTDNVQNFINVSSGSVYFEIFDITRDILITSRDIELGSIALNWHVQAQSGSTNGSTIYRTELFSGMMNASPGYDCIWQMRADVDPPETFDYRINAYQELYYNKFNT